MQLFRLRSIRGATSAIALAASSAAWTQAPVVDPQAVALLRKNQEAMLALKGYRAECRTVQENFGDAAKSVRYRYSQGFLTAAKPNLMRYDSWDLSDSPVKTGWKRPTRTASRTFVSDGKKQWRQFGLAYRVEDNAEPQTLTTILEPWQGFFARERSIYGEVLEAQKAKQSVSVRRAGRETVAGLPLDRVEIVQRYEDGDRAFQIRKIVSLGSDGLVRRQSFEFSQKGKLGFVQTTDLVRIEKNPDLRNVRYVYTPPANVTLSVPPKEVPLLANGTVAPDFEVVDKDGAASRLSDLKGKVVVLDFWASWCGPCLNSMPHTQDVAAKLQKEGLSVVVLAVDDGEARDAFAAWVGGKGTSYPALRFVYSPQAANVSGKLYQVTGIPTQYVIDADGKIRASFVGYGGPTEELEKAIRAAL